jgi:formamidopyrimidine-DNA glycosylase
VPELPEVETTVRLLRPRLVDREIRGARVLWARTLGGQSAKEFEKRVCGVRIARLWRRAKFVVLDLERAGRPAGALLCHLRMTGRLYMHGESDGQDEYVRVRLPLDRGELVFLDVRKFGRLRHFEDPAEVFATLGPEPLDETFDVEAFRAALRDRRGRLKSLLLDQSFLAGLGNIYTDEALHRARLHPLARADRLRRADVERLHAAIRTTLADAIEREGSSFDTFYRTPEGRPGSYQSEFQVYGRENAPCRTCTTPIRRLVIGQRGTHLCPRCQQRRRS